MEERAQAQFEVILLILLVIVAVTVVALYLKNAASTITDSTQAQVKQNP